ncbi:hypothetical protein CSOJ01_13414 [Colletotrichum sojae]|uniref:Ankyrin repeat protein n=1 Tax=Colletotrichum sojae TaxID=2175907 RepID=A0A8H6MKL2_9PEZI|nr:hypothetical protein CSOJ01_13414 [Colletotrichum sojae]
MEICNGGTGAALTIRMASTHDWGRTLQKEFEDHSEVCFVRVASDFALGKITLQEYLDAILGHLKQGYAKHKYDVKYWYEEGGGDDVTNYMEWDLFAGAVKARSAGIDPSFKGMPDNEFCWTSNNPAEFDCQLEGQTDGSPVSELSVFTTDLLLVICYARRHFELFQHLISQSPSPPEVTMFDLFDSHIIATRLSGYLQIHQHSPKHPDNARAEVMFWTELLNSRWVHEPMRHGLNVALCDHIPIGQEWSEWVVKLGSPELEAFQRALVARGHYTSISSIGSYLGMCDTFEKAQRIFDIFDGEGLVKATGYPSLPTWASGGLVLSVARSPFNENNLRSRIMAMALQEIRGVDVNALSDGWQVGPGGGAMASSNLCTALHVAACNGDKPLAEVLLQYGARVEAELPLAKDKKTKPADMARQAGHVELADWLDQQPFDRA